MGRGRPFAALVLSVQENNQLVEWARRGKPSQALALRAHRAGVRASHDQRQYRCPEASDPRLPRDPQQEPQTVLLDQER